MRDDHIDLLCDAAEELAIHIRKEEGDGYGNQFSMTPEEIDKALAMVRSDSEMRARHPDFLPDDGIPVIDASSLFDTE